MPRRLLLLDAQASPILRVDSPAPGVPRPARTVELSFGVAGDVLVPGTVTASRLRRVVYAEGATLEEERERAPRPEVLWSVRSPPRRRARLREIAQPQSRPLLGERPSENRRSGREPRIRLSKAACPGALGITATAAAATVNAVARCVAPAARVLLDRATGAARRRAPGGDAIASDMPSLEDRTVAVYCRTTGGAVIALASDGARRAVRGGTAEGLLQTDRTPRGEEHRFLLRAARAGVRGWA
jgi:hypothetical protein